MCGLAARAVETEFGDDEFVPARCTIDLFKAARDIVTSTRVRIVRSGGRIRVVDVDVVQHPEGADEVLRGGRREDDLAAGAVVLGIGLVFGAPAIVDEMIAAVGGALDVTLVDLTLAVAEATRGTVAPAVGARVLALAA